MLGLELLKVKADLEREPEDFVLNCRKCDLDVPWVAASSLPGTGRTASPRRTASCRLAHSIGRGALRSYAVGRASRLKDMSATSDWGLTERPDVHMVAARR